MGLSHEELKILGQCNSKEQSVETIKVSRRDMAYVVSKKMNGGTTVAGTLIVASMVGINVFATGGIGNKNGHWILFNRKLLMNKNFPNLQGGVHRDGNVTMDVSADLVELGRNAVAVVASGVKSILDIPKTLEFLVSEVEV